MNRFIHRHILLPAFETGLKRRRTLRYWSGLEKTQWLARDAIEELQLRALQRLMAHAHDNCPFYRRTWDTLGLHPRRLSALSDITSWPVTDRDTIRANR